MKPFFQKFLLGIGVLLMLIFVWNLLVLLVIPPSSFTFTDSEGKPTRIETRTYLFYIGETRCYVDDVFVNKSISVTFGGKAYIHTYNTDHVLIDSVSYTLP